MAEQIYERLEELKQEIAAEIAALVVGEVRKLTEILKSGGPDAMTKPAACKRLGVGRSKLDGMIRSKEISVCIIGKKEMIPTEEIRRLTEPVFKPKRRAGGAPKKKPYDAKAEAQRGREMLKKR